MRTINAKQLRAHLAEVVTDVMQGGRVTVLYRSRPAFDIVPVGAPAVREVPPERDSLYRAGPTGSSGTGRAAREHDEVLYP